MAGVETSTLYRAFTKDVLSGTDPASRDLGLQALDRYFAPKAERVIPPSSLNRSQTSRRVQFELWDLALRALGTEFYRYKLTGEADKALALAKISQEASSRHMRDAIKVYGTDNRIRMVNLQGEPRDILLRAARRHVLATRDLSDLTDGKGTLNKRDSLTFIDSSLYLQYSPVQDRVAEIFGEDGRNEVRAALVSARRIKPYNIMVPFRSEAPTTATGNSF